MKNVQKYFIPIWRITVVTVAVTVFTILISSMPIKANSVRLGRVLMPQTYMEELITQDSKIEVTQTNQPQELTYK